MQACLAEVADDDTTLVPRLSMQAIALADGKVAYAELQRLEAQQAARASQRVQKAESTAARLNEATSAHDSEMALLKRRLANSLKRTKELQEQLDAVGGRHWVPPGSSRAGTASSSHPGSPAVHAAGRGSSRAKPPRGAGGGTPAGRGAVATPADGRTREGRPQDEPDEAGWSPDEEVPHPNSAAPEPEPVPRS